jgi:hypothetical protein
LAETFSESSEPVGKADIDGVAEFTKVGTSGVCDVTSGGVGVDMVVN